MKYFSFNPKKNKEPLTGFTLMEVIVATTIFVLAVSAMLSLFNYTLKINRRVQSLRQVAQGTRNFTEFITREIRNGQIDYAPADPTHCSGNYSSASNQSLALINLAGERVCFYYDSATFSLMISKKAPNGSIIAEKVNPPNFKVKDPFRFVVRPTTDPSAGQGVQPFVVIMALFEIQLSAADPAITIPYQTTISTDVYDTPHTD